MTDLPLIRQFNTQVVRHIYSVGHCMITPLRLKAFAVCLCLLGVLLATVAVGSAWAFYLSLSHDVAFAFRSRGTGVVEIQRQPFPVNFWIFVSLWAVAGGFSLWGAVVALKHGHFFWRGSSTAPQP